MNDTSTTPVYCHHCGAEIVFNRTFPDKSNSHWAHAIRVFNGKAHSLENTLMEQRCADRIHWATPRRGAGSPVDLRGGGMRPIQICSQRRKKRGEVWAVRYKPGSRPFTCDDKQSALRYAKSFATDVKTAGPVTVFLTVHP